MSTVLRHRLFWPVAMLVALLLSNLFFTSGFFAIEVRDGHLFGSVIDILRQGAPLMLVALGMTLVIATGGIDLSVGAVVAISGAMACQQIAGLADQGAVGGVLFAVVLALLLCAGLGAWNGFLVSVVGIQPIIATLILMVAGRGIAQVITDGQIVNVNSPPYKTIATGFLLAIPVPVIIAVAVVAAVALVTRRSAFGMLLESVGGNAGASRLAGIRSRRLIIIAYVVCAVCAGVAGLMVSSTVSSADGNNNGLLIELDAILAVVIGGTSLLGGRFSIAGTVIGALLIKTLDTTIYTIGIPPEVALLFKAVVVVILCLVQSPAFRAKVSRRQPAEVTA